MSSGKVSLMGAIVAVRRKTNQDATESALTMLKTFTARNVESYGIASQSVHIEQTVEQLRTSKLDSPTIIGYVFSRALKEDEAQPIKTKNATLVFDGRTYPIKTLCSDAHFFCEHLSMNTRNDTAAFIRKAEGDFAFALAESDTLIAGRDAVGVHPLYYGENKDLFALASERKALWSIGIEAPQSFPPGNLAIVKETGLKFFSVKEINFHEPMEVSMETAVRKLRILLKRAVNERIGHLGDVVVAFSGGLDSSVIAFLCKKSGANVQLIHISLKGQAETEHAKAAAEELDLPIQVRTYVEQDLREALPAVVRSIEEPEPVKVSVGVPVHWAALETAKMGYRVMLTGQGGDELFGGYRRYVDQFIREGKEAVSSTFFRDIVAMHDNNFERDFKICNSLDVELRLPFAAWQVVMFALQLPVELKIQASENTPRKLVLRQVARSLGLPETIASRPKRALQYATGVNTALRKIAQKQNLTVRECLQKTFQDAVR